METISIYGWSSIKDVYTKVYPNDSMARKEMNDKVTFDALYLALNEGAGAYVYEYLGVGDSLIRERVFDLLSKLLGKTYADIYEMWINSERVMDTNHMDIELTEYGYVVVEPDEPDGMTQTHLDEPDEVDEVDPDKARETLEGMLNEVGLSLDREMDGTYLIKDEQGRLVVPEKFYEDEVADWDGIFEVVLANEEQGKVIMSETFDKLIVKLY